MKYIYFIRIYIKNARIKVNNIFDFGKCCSFFNKIARKEGGRRRKRKEKNKKVRRRKWK